MEFQFDSSRILIEMDHNKIQLSFFYKPYYFPVRKVLFSYFVIKKATIFFFNYSVLLFSYYEKKSFCNFFNGYFRKCHAQKSNL